MSDDTKLDPKVRPQGGGRAKGTPNKRSWRIRMDLEEHGFDPIREFMKAFAQIDEPTERMASLAWLFRYVYPQLKEVDAEPSATTEPQTNPASTRSTEALLSLLKETPP